MSDYLHCFDDEAIQEVSDFNDGMFSIDENTRCLYGPHPDSEPLKVLDLLKDESSDGLILEKVPIMQGANLDEKILFMEERLQLYTEEGNNYYKWFIKTPIDIPDTINNQELLDLFKSWNEKVEELSECDDDELSYQLSLTRCFDVFAVTIEVNFHGNLFGKRVFLEDPYEALEVFASHQCYNRECEYLQTIN